MSSMRRSRRRAAQAAVTVLVGVLAGGGCQPVDEIDGLSGPEPDSPSGEDYNPRGAPDVGLPGSLAEALARAEAPAAEWQHGARLAEAVVQVDEEGLLTEWRLTYLAPHADRFLTVEVTPAGLRQERPTLETLNLTPIPGEAVEALPPLPEEVREPPDLVAAASAAFAACDVEGVPSTVLYATGAPLAWDPAAGTWTLSLDWTATVMAETGAGAVLDPVTTTAMDCLAPPS